MNNQGTTGGASGGKDDLLDKGKLLAPHSPLRLAAAQKKFGGAKFGDPNKTKATNEKITDKARGMFEKSTGMKVPKWLSN
ncbi:hypothetical protein H2199_002116 [Coniosporium tulheliwenetii]|uniref:Uncharacterized protein n=1 Tax=Coniosporium tulheliwenetii TaxID=3383036 RepID=A0ACC2ZHW0_9PEZI|nr:hypothetical protein H2199_002116 [Cladosporium sp. JES 115]